MKSPSAKNGYVLLLTVLVVGVMASATAVSLILLGLGIERSAYSIQLSSQARMAAWTCMENAIRSLQEDLEYTGNHDRSFVYGYEVPGQGLQYGTTTCRIYPIGGEGNEGRILCVEGTFGDFTTRRFQVHVSRVLPSPIITSWEEAEAITDCDAFTGPPPTDCGNGLVQGDIGEECDDGNTVNNDGCSSVCDAEICGDGTHQAGEECDDGNLVAGDGCSESCTAEVCGDSSLDAGEECDDGNLVDNDGCSSLCQIEECGDGIVQTGEECDDNNTTDGDGCDASCRIEIVQETGPSDYIAYWKLDETNPNDQAVDSGPSGFTGTPQSGVGVITSGLAPFTFGNSAARDFDGVTDRVNTSNSSALFPDQMTVSFWTKNDVYPAQFDGILCKTRQTSWNQGWGFFYNSWNQVAFFIEQWNSNIVYASINPLVWNHIVGTYNGSTLRIYVNGVPGTSDSFGGTLHKDRTLEFGRCGDSSAANSFNINGKIDDVRIYDRILSEDEISALASGN